MALESILDASSYMISVEATVSVSSSMLSVAAESLDCSSWVSLIVVSPVDSESAGLSPT